MTCHHIGSTVKFRYILTTILSTTPSLLTEEFMMQSAIPVRRLNEYSQRGDVTAGAGVSKSGHKVFV